MGKNIIKSLASGLGLGYIPIASGTFGSLLGIPLYIVFVPLPPLLRLLSIIAFTFFAIYIAEFAEAEFGKRDSSKIVIDEIAGMMWALVFVPTTATDILIAFVLFRFFDIAKIFPANYCERELRGGWAVVLDDVVAGIYAGIAAFLIGHLINLFI